MINNLIKTIFGITLSNKVYFFLIGDRLNPGIANISMIHFMSLKKYILSFIERFVRPKDTILDFGCGNMIYKDFFLTKECNYFGLDIGDSPENNGNYIVYEGGEIPFENNRFEIVFSTQVFEHLNDIKFYAQELERVTKNEGHILLTIAHVWEYHPYPKHYQNVMYDIIPEIFQKSEIIECKGDTSPFQNIALFNMKYMSKYGFLGILYNIIVNTYLTLLDMFGLLKIGPTTYNSLTGNILLVLKVKK